MAIDPLIGQVLGKRYQIERLLGQGGMGNVYQAVHCELDKKVAVKMLLPQIAENAEAYERFRREARAASRLRHPNILEVTDFDHTDQGAPYMVMEFMEGEDLSALLTRERRLTLDRAVDIFRDVLDAVGAAHNGGIIHRDLKPENIFLSRYGSREAVPKVLDFGISKIMDATSLLTRDQSMMGTPNYMAPEQATGKTGQADARTDVFAMGAILYRALSGKEAFGAGKPLSIVYRVVNEEPRPLGEVAPHIPVAVQAVVARAMAKKPDDRYPTAAALAAALELAARDPDAALAPDQAPRPPTAATSLATPEDDIGLAGTLPPPANSEPEMSLLSQDLDEPLPGRERRSSGMVGITGGAVLLLALGLGAWYLQRGNEAPAPEVKPAPAVVAEANKLPPDAGLQPDMTRHVAQKTPDKRRATKPRPTKRKPPREVANKPTLAPLPVKEAAPPVADKPPVAATDKPPVAATDKPAPRAPKRYYGESTSGTLPLVAPKR